MSALENKVTSTEDTNHVELNAEQIKRLIPHRSPMLMVERLIKVISGESAIGIKNSFFGGLVFSRSLSKKACDARSNDH